MAAPASAQTILHFWFGPKPYNRARVQQHLRLWFPAAVAPELVPQADELIRERFAETLQAAETGALQTWESSPRRRLALILVLDQFSRHCYRGTPQAFAQDHAALSLSVSGMQFGAEDVYKRQLSSNALPTWPEAPVINTFTGRFPHP